MPSLCMRCRYLCQIVEQPVSSAAQVCSVVRLLSEAQVLSVAQVWFVVRLSFEVQRLFLGWVWSLPRVLSAVRLLSVAAALFQEPKWLRKAEDKISFQCMCPWHN